MLGPLIYTAQSKREFYCRDAVCEFVFKRGAIPLHPFQLFGYFLNDRVDRDAVRAANRVVLERSDEVWVFGDTLADGVVVEICQALQLGKPLKFFSIDSHSSAIASIEPNRLKFEKEVAHTSGMPQAELVRCLQAGNAHLVVEALGRTSELRA